MRGEGALRGTWTGGRERKPSGKITKRGKSLVVEKGASPHISAMATDKTFKDITASIAELAKRGHITKEQAFAAWYAMNFHGVDEDEALEAAAVDGGNDQGIDLVFSDDAQESIHVIQAHYPTATRPKPTPKAKWDAVTSSIGFVIDPEQLEAAGRPDLAEQIKDQFDTNPDYSLIFGLISLGLKSNEIEAAVKAQKGTTKKMSFFYNGREDIVTGYKAIVDGEAGISDDTISFVGEYIRDEGDYGRAWIGSVSAAELQRLYKAHEQELFAGNVRLFLGARKGGINEQIIKTAAENPGVFWALNNGITIVADTVEPVEPDDDDETHQLRVKRFSIVNGCQTTSSLVEAEASEDAKVLARVIAAKQTLRTDIVRYNNSQNAVRIWSVRSADNIQKKLRKEFEAIGVIYAPKLEGARRKRDLDIIELDKVAQYIAASQTEFLIQAIANKGALFDQPYQKLFPKGVKPQDVYLAWLIGNIADEKRAALYETLEEDENAQLLGVTSTYWISYVTKKIIDKRKAYSAEKISLACMKTAEFRSGLAKHVQHAAEMFFDAAVDSYDRDDYGSFKATLRSSKFLSKIDSKIGLRIGRLRKGQVPDLKNVCRTLKK